MVTTPAPSFTTHDLTGQDAPSVPTGFRYFAPEDVVVLLTQDGVSGAPLTPNVDYTLTGADPAANGGTVTLAPARVPPGGWPPNSRLVVRRRTVRRQGTALPDYEGHKPRATERALDRQMRIAEEDADDVARAVVAPFGERGVELPPQATRANRVLAFSEDGLVVVMPFTVPEFMGDVQAVGASAVAVETARAVVAALKAQVEQDIATAPNLVGNKVDKAGGTMTGPLRAPLLRNTTAKAPLRMQGANNDDVAIELQLGPDNSLTPPPGGVARVGWRTRPFDGGYFIRAWAGVMPGQGGWFQTLFPNTDDQAAFQGISGAGNIGVLAATRTADNPLATAQLSANINICENNSALGSAGAYGTGFAGYDEVRRTSPYFVSIGREHNVCNLVNDTPDIRPGFMFAPGATIAASSSAGRPASDGQPADMGPFYAVSVGYLINCNGNPVTEPNNTFKRGLVIGENALLATGDQQAVSLDKKHKVAFLDEGVRKTYLSGTVGELYKKGSAVGDGFILNFVRERTGGVAGNDSYGEVRFGYNDGPGIQTKARMTANRQTLGADLTLSATNASNASLSVVVCKDGGNTFSPSTDGVQGLGAASFRWERVRAVNGVDTTSDGRLKDNIHDPEATLLNVVRGLGVKLFQWKSAIAEKGADAARWHASVIAQDFVAGCEAAGLDPYRYGVIGADPWMEEVEEPYSEEVPLTEWVEEIDLSYQIDAFGAANLVETPRLVEREVAPNFVPVFKDGEPVMQPAVPAMTVLADGSARARRADDQLHVVNPGDAVKATGFQAARPAVQQYLQIQPTRMETRTRTVSRQRTDPGTGLPMMKLSVNVGELLFLMVAALRADAAGAA